MSKITLDPSALAKLRALRDRAELCDETGKTVGYFVPFSDPAFYEGEECPVPEEELRRREQNLTGRPLADILVDLGQRAL